MVNCIKELETKAFREFKDKAAQYNQSQKPLKPVSALFPAQKGSRRQNIKTSSGARGIKTAGSTTESLFSDDSYESEGSQDGDDGDGGLPRSPNHNSEEEDAGVGKDLFNQVRRQYKQEMQDREKYEEGLSDDEETFEDDDSLLSDEGNGGGDQNEIMMRQRLYKKKTEARPQTAKSSRPVTAGAHARSAKFQQSPK
jgi:hypothetical protein